MSYELPRDATESARLDAQYRLYTDTIGYLLHPEILATLGNEACIADIGCGTGVWLLELAQKSPGTWHFQGLDMSSAQYPQNRNKVAPMNCDFSTTLNILQPIPEALRGKFDVVHLSLLIAGLSSVDAWRSATDNIAQLLKPGGWVQWQESDFTHIDCLRHEAGSSAAALKKWRDVGVQIWMGNDHDRLNAVRGLLRTVKAAGFEDCQEDVMSSDRLAENRAIGSDVTHRALTAIVKGIRQEDPEKGGWSEDEIKDLVRQTTEDMQSGKAYWRWDIYVVIGRKRMNVSIE